MTVKTKYFKTYAEAVVIRDSLAPFKPSKYLNSREIESGLGCAVINEFGKGFAVQLGGCGAYYPATNNNSENL